jgi:hypothetical protein
MSPDTFGWVIFFALSLSLIGSIFLPLYLWHFRKVRESKIFKVARGVRMVFAVIILLVAVVMFFKSDKLNGEFIGETAGRLFVAYLLIRRWAPKNNS